MREVGVIEIHPTLDPFYEGVWTATMSDVPYPGLNVPHLIRRLRQELSHDRPITWEDIFTICHEKSGIPAYILETALPEYTFAVMQLVNAWLLQRHPNVDTDRILAVAQAVGEIAATGSAYGPPDHRAAYDKVYAVRRRFSGDLTQTSEVDRLLAEVEGECLL